MSDEARANRVTHRRDLIRGMMLGALGESMSMSTIPAVAKEPGGCEEGAARALEAPSGSLVPWMYVPVPLEHWLFDYQRIFDAWADGGIRGIAIGPLTFFQEAPFVDLCFDPSYRWIFSATRLPAFSADPKVYKSFGVAPPAERPRDPKKEKQLQALLDNAASRGWEILLMGSGQTGGARPLREDPFGVVGFAAGVQDTINAFPQANSLIIDGAGEHHYELAFHHGGELFELREHQRLRLMHLGFDIERAQRGITHLRDRFHHLTPSMVRYYSSGGMLGGLTLFDLNEDALYWLRTRQEVALRYIAAVREQINKLNRKVKLGTIPRTASFSLLTAQDYQKTHQYFDYIFPKHYFWHRGFDGMYGTIARWVAKIAEWNAGLGERDCFAVVKAWFGLELPGIHSLAQMEMGFPDEFFSKVVYSETRRALDAVGDDNKVIAWVSSGRHPHGGGPMPAHDLYRILAASQRAGLKRFMYHPDPDLGVPEWKLISRFGGKEWKEDPSGYWPSNTPRPDTWNGGRKPGDVR